jgi:hypothetical protein
MPPLPCRGSLSSSTESRIGATDRTRAIRSPDGSSVRLSCHTGAVDDANTSKPPPLADERVTLTGFLESQRAILAVKCAGLTAAQLREPAVPPSPLSLLGLVRHMAEVEQSWFQLVMSGQPSPYHWPQGAGEDPGDSAEFDVTDADPDEAFDVWRAECARSRDFVDGAESLDVNGHYGDETFSLRYVLTHMIEEYARHNGHADLLRERIDGVTGD